MMSCEELIVMLKKIDSKLRAWLFTIHLILIFKSRKNIEKSNGRLKYYCAGHLNTTAAVFKGC
jgi:hypothetical protein